MVIGVIALATGIGAASALYFGRQDKVKSASQQRSLREIFTAGIVHYVSASYVRLDDLEEVSDELRKAPLYLRLSIAALLVEETASYERCELRGYTYGNDDQDLNWVAGRSAFLLEKALGVPLPRLAPNSTTRHVDHLHAEAAKAYNALRQQIVAQHMAIRDPSVDPALKMKYAGKIDPTRSAARFDEDVLALYDLLNEWFPLGRKMRELEEIVGHEAQRYRDGFCYTFDEGYGGVRFVFRTREGLIDSVFVYFLD